jgi:WD40 repeat protein
MAVIEVAIGPGGMPGKFRVEVIDSPAGHPSATTGLDAGALTARSGVLQLEVLASSALARGVPETEQFLRSTGQALFAGLLGADGIAGCYRASAALAAERGEELRVVLRIDDPVLAGLPWEAMFDHEAGAYVCRRDQLVRHVPVASAPAPLQVRPPLRILGVVSSPRDLRRLDADAEKEYLARALAGPVSQGLAEVHWAPEATWAGLQDVLTDGEWHVLHYVGHGDFNAALDEGVLALEREDGHADLRSASGLVDLLRQARPMPRLVVLNSCAGAATGAGDLFSGTAAALVRGGVPAVTAMQYKISDGAAIAFARGFYAAIARGRGIDDAVSAGRVAILGTSDRTLEWVTPVLYLRGPQARLFTLPSSVTAGTADNSRFGTTAAQPQVSREPMWRTVRPSPTEHLDAAPRCLATRAEGSGGVNSVAFGSTEWSLPSLATSGNDNTVRLWTIYRSDEPHGDGVLEGHSLGVHAVAFSPGKPRFLLATSGNDDQVHLWDPSDPAFRRGEIRRKRLATLTRDPERFSGPHAVAFSPNGRLLATSGEKAQLWDVTKAARPRQLAALTAHAHVSAVAFSPSGRLLATSGIDTRVHLWDLGDPARPHDLGLLTEDGDLEGMTAVAFSPTGRFLAASGLNEVVLWTVSDPARPQRLMAITGYSGRVNVIAFAPDGSLMATSASENEVHMWDVGDLAAPRHVTTLTDPAGRIEAVAFSPDGHLLATGGNDARLWDLRVSP